MDFLGSKAIILQAHALVLTSYKETQMNDQEHLYVCAVRYGLGRKTYITSIISSFLMQTKLSDYCTKLIIRDIEKCDNYGHDCDKECWIQLLNHLKSSLNE